MEVVKPIKEYPWFVILVAVISPLILYSNNLGEVTLASLWVPIILSVMVGLGIFVLSYVIIRDYHKAGFVTGVIEIVLFSYGHIYNLLKPVQIAGISIGRHRYLLVPIFLIACISIYQIIKSQSDYRNITKIFNLVFSIYFVFQVVIIGIYELRSFISQTRAHEGSEIIEVDDNDKNQRDIYLIVLDAYSRSDWLKEWSGFDNTEFLDALEDMGFYVVECSRSNYYYTIQSMTSELNMDYLQNLSVPYTNMEMSARLKNSDVRNTLKNLGYEFVFFETGYPWIEMTDADQYIAADEISLFNDDFQFLFLKTTLLLVPYDAYRVIATRQIDIRAEQQASRVWSVLSHLKQPLQSTNPVFVYAHIVSPHSPRIFNVDGSINYKWEQEAQQTTQTTYQYLNNEVLEIVADILKGSDPEPIIIIQADHGDGDLGYRNLILNAYYLPQGGSNHLYSTISPVNTFRVIFNHYFQKDYPLLEDLSYYSHEDSRFDFELILDPYEECRSLKEQ